MIHGGAVEYLNAAEAIQTAHHDLPVIEFQLEAVEPEAIVL